MKHLLLTAFVKNVCVEEILNYSFFWIEILLTNLAILLTFCYKHIWNVIAFVQMHYNLFIHSNVDTLVGYFGGGYYRCFFMNKVICTMEGIWMNWLLSFGIAKLGHRLSIWSTLVYTLYSCTCLRQYYRDNSLLNIYSLLYMEYYRIKIY